MRAVAACLTVCLLLGAAPLPPLSPPNAEAAVSVAYSLEELVAASPRVTLVRAGEQRSEWAVVGGSRRIVTYTRLEMLESVIGETGPEVWVRTLGGVVGRIGQQVGGEAVFSAGERAVVFLTKATDGTWIVTGMGQGHYPLRTTAATKDSSAVERLTPSPQTGTLLPRRSGATTAHERLVGKPVHEALEAIRAARRGADARPR